MPARRRTEAEGERTRRIMDLRRQRVPVVEIADELGITHGRVSQIYMKALREIPAASVQEHRAEQNILTDSALRSLLAIAADHDVSPRTRVEAWSAARGWAEHQARILGLNAPVKVEVSDAVDAELQRLAAELAVMEPGRETEAAGSPAAGEVSAPAP